jgi:hypothetical protein
VRSIRNGGAVSPRVLAWLAPLAVAVTVVVVVKRCMLWTDEFAGRLWMPPAEGAPLLPEDCFEDVDASDVPDDW